MLDIKDYKKISLEFRRVASNFLRTEYTNQGIPLRRFYNYIEKEKSIKQIIDEKIKGVVFDYHNCFCQDEFGRNYIDIPVDEGCHIKAMLDYLKFIVDNNISLDRISMDYPCDSRRFDDYLQNYIDIAFKPLIDFIQDELSKKMIMLEEKKMSNIDMSNNKGTINYANKNSSINSYNIINKNDLNEILKIIEIIKDDMNHVDFDDEKKDNIIDDVEIVQEQLQNNIEKPTRLKRAFNNIKEFISNAALLTGVGITLGNNIQQLVLLLQPIIDKI